MVYKMMLSERYKLPSDSMVWKFLNQVFCYGRPEPPSEAPAAVPVGGNGEPQDGIFVETCSFSVLRWQKRKDCSSFFVGCPFLFANETGRNLSGFPVSVVAIVIAVAVVGNIALIIISSAFPSAVIYAAVIAVGVA